MYARLAVVVAVAVAHTSCVYAALGAKHNLVVAENLEAGMAREAAIEAVADGGSITLESEIAAPVSGNWAESIDDDRLLAHILVAQARQDRKVAVILPISRSWGFFGFGIFHLFFDETEQLVGYHMRHIN